jgi:predicted dehydrogenase
MAASESTPGRGKDGVLRVGIIGAGGIAQGAHVPGYQATEGVELYAACDVVEGRAQAMADKVGIPHIFTSYEEMLKLPELDIVSVCTPPFAHKDATIAALQAGKHVMCEKPMALDGAEAQEMVDVWKAVRGRFGTTFSIGFQSRHTRNARLLKRYIDAGELGELYYGRTAALRRRGVPGWGVFTDRSKNGGGPLIDIGVHALDLALWFLGHPEPASVYGVTYRKFGNRAGVYNPWGAWDPKTFDVEDSAFAMIRFRNGATLQLECSWALNIEKSMSQTVLCGTEGGAQLHPFKIFQERHGTIVDVVPPEGVTEGQGRSEPPSHVLEMQAFVKAIREGSDPLVMPEQALMVSRIVDAIYASDESGESIKL